MIQTFIIFYFYLRVSPFYPRSDDHLCQFHQTFGCHMVQSFAKVPRASLHRLWQGERWDRWDRWDTGRCPDGSGQCPESRIVCGVLHRPKARAERGAEDT